jgi:hypothetical protein
MQQHGRSRGRRRRAFWERGHGAPGSLPAKPEAASGGPMREDRGAPSPFITEISG